MSSQGQEQAKSYADRKNNKNRVKPAIYPRSGDRSSLLAANQRTDAFVSL